MLCSALRGRVWAPTRLKRTVLGRPQSSDKEEPTTDQKEVEATGRRGWGEARLVSEESSDLKKNYTTGFIASCVIRKAKGDGQSHPLQVSCLSFAFGIGYSAREGVSCRCF